MSDRTPSLVIYWGDTRQILSNEERAELFHHATLEALDFDEVLIRDLKSRRLAVIAGLGTPNIYCSLCLVEKPEEHFGGECLRLGKCVLTGEDSRLKERKKKG